MAKKTARKDDNGSKGPMSTVAREGIKSNTYIAALAMRGAVPFQRLLVYVCYGIILIILLVLLIPPYESLKQLIAMSVGVLTLFISGMMVLRRYNELSQGTAKPTPTPQASSPRSVGVSQVVREQARKVLEEARTTAYEFLKTKNPGLALAQIRANIFFPEYGESGKANDYKLKIFPGLHINMDRPREREISFEPGQGATGNVFKSGQSRVTQRLGANEVQSGGGGWDLVFNITDELAAIIHPELKWIISMPLKGEDGKPIGVMNVDGLTHEFIVDVLYDCVGKLTMYAVYLGRLFKGD